MSTIFNGTFTLIGPRGHRTLKVKTVRAGSLEGRRIVSLMTGSDNESDFTGFGFVNPDNSVSVWRKFAGSDKEIIGRVFVKLYMGGEIPGYSIEASKSCIVCNRKLTSPESLESGIGPECSGRKSRAQHGAARITREVLRGVTPIS